MSAYCFLVQHALQPPTFYVANYKPVNMETYLAVSQSNDLPSIECKANECVVSDYQINILLYYGHGVAVQLKLSSVSPHFSAV